MTLRFALLGTEVVVSCEVAEARARLETCYAAVRDGEADGPPLAARLDPRGHGFEIEVAGRSPVAARDWPAAVRAFNHELLHGVMLRNRGYFYVHAGVVAHSGRAVVLPGLSRAGKSTLVLALLARGAGYLSDELFVWDPESGDALPYPRAPKVRDECVAYFPAHAGAFVGEGEGRFLRAAAVEIAAPAPPALVVAPRWDAAGDDALAPLSPGETVLRLVSSALNFGMQRERSVDWLAVLGGRAAGHDLTWRDPHAAAGAILAALVR